MTLQAQPAYLEWWIILQIDHHHHLTPAPYDTSSRAKSINVKSDGINIYIYIYETAYEMIN